MDEGTRLAIIADAQRRTVVEAGAAAVNAQAGNYYDELLVAVAAAFRIHLGKQFDAKQFIQEVGRLRLRKLPMQAFNLTDDAGVFVNVEATVEAPSDRHQLVLTPIFEFAGTDGNGDRNNLDFRDAALIDFTGRLEVRRPQSDSVPEALSDYSMGSQQFRFDNGAAGAEVSFEMNRQNWASHLPWGIEAGIRFSFAALPKLNQLVLSVNNLTGGPDAPSASQIQGALHVYVIDCILGGN